MNAREISTMSIYRCKLPTGSIVDVWVPEDAEVYEVAFRENQSAQQLVLHM